uniref:Uncharacterized protein n=1 Tax=Oryza brachyantha TaxID=4533 RepID=J3LPA2_ORYBR
MQDFNAAAGDGDGRDGFRASSSRWSGREDPGLEESTLGYNRHGVQHNASQNPNLGQDDEVIVMDGVLVGNNSVSVPCYPSNQGYVPASYYGGTASYYAPNLQLIMNSLTYLIQFLSALGFVDF